MAGRVSYRFGAPPPRMRQAAAVLAAVAVVTAAVSIGNCLIDIALPGDATRTSFRDHRIDSPAGTFYEYAGLIHLHTTYSDGSGTYGEVIGIADSLGADFIMPADHNTVKPAAEGWGRYAGNLLVIPAVEASADNGGGHFVIMGDHTPLVRSSTVPSDSVFHDSLRGGNTIILAHVFHPHKNDWDDWDIGPFTGMELFNFDENWRANLSFSRLSRLLAALVVYPFNQAAVNHAISRPARQLNRFDELNRSRKVVGTGVTDAHSSIDLPGGGLLRFPSYASMFELVRTFIVSDEPYTGDYTHDRALTLEAIHDGNMFVGFPRRGDPAGFLLSAESGGEVAVMGDSLRIGEEAAGITCMLPDSTGVRIDVYHDGELIGRFENRGHVTITAVRPGAYRVEVVRVRRMLPLFIPRDLPWILSNPVYLYDGEPSPGPDSGARH